MADLIAYRRTRERLVERGEEFELETPAGHARAITYTTPFDPVEHLALVIGQPGDAPLVRLHRGDVLEDVFGARDTLNRVFERFREEGNGILVYLREGAAGVPAARLGQAGAGGEEDTASARAREQAWRDVGLGAQILRDLGCKNIRLLASSERHYVGLSGFGIEIAETILDN